MYPERKCVIIEQITSMHTHSATEGDNSCSVDNMATSNALHLALHGLCYFQLFNSLQEMKTTRILTKSNIPISLVSWNCLRSQFSSDPKINEADLEGHLKAFGLQMVPVTGDEEIVFFYSRIIYAVKHNVFPGNLRNSTTFRESWY